MPGGCVDARNVVPENEPRPDRLIDLSEGRRRWWPFGRRNIESVGSVADTAVRLRPLPREVSDSDQGLDMIRDWMRYFAFIDASRNDESTVLSSRGLAHLSLDDQGVGTREVMEIHSIAAMSDKYAVVFSRGGFTSGAIRWADKNPTALFEFDRDGQVTAASETAQRLLAGSDERHLAEMSDTDLD